MKKILLGILLAFCVSSCATDQEPASPVASKQEAMSSRMFHSDSVLNFTSEANYQSFVSQLSQLLTEEEKMEFVRERFPKFQSMHDLYCNAMEEAENLDETKSAYQSFEKKYSQLYFPHVGEDAGFYIPIQNLDVAFIANPNGEVCIAGKARNVKDIDNYRTLQSLGRAYYAPTKTTMKAKLSIFDEEKPKPTTFNMNYFDFARKSLNIGREYDSGWSEYGKRKLKIKLRRWIHKPDVNARAYMHLEFCFRKKTLIGWINFKSKSTITGNLVSEDNTKTYLFTFFGTGMSSHDFDLPILPQIVDVSGNRKQLLFGKHTIEISAKHKDVSEPMVRSYTFENCRSDQTWSQIQEVPHFILVKKQ